MCDILVLCDVTAAIETMPIHEFMLDVSRRAQKAERGGNIWSLAGSSKQLSYQNSKMHSHGKEKGNRQLKPHPSGSKIPESLFSVDECAKHIIDSALGKIQKQLLDKTKQYGTHKANNPSFGCNRHDSNLDRAGGNMGARFPHLSPSRRGGGRQEPHHRELQKEDFSSILTSTIQKVMREAVSNADENANSTNRGHKVPPLECKPSRIKAFPKPTTGARDMFGAAETLDMDQLMKSMTKLCLLETEGNGSDLASGDTSNKQKSYGCSAPTLGGPRRATLTRSSGRQHGSNGVIVTNQNGDSGSLNKELQAVLQWMVASQFNVPNLTFLNDRDGELSDLPRLAQRAAKKGYSVGNILQEVMRYLERLPMDDAVGQRPQCGLIRWLLANL